MDDAVSVCTACCDPLETVAPSKASSSSTLTPAKRKSDGSLACTFRHPRQSFWNIRCYCVFSYMPDALIVNGVFRYLSPAELCGVAGTCKRWNFLAQDRSLWKHFDIQSLPITIPSHTVSWLMQKHATSIEVLKLCDAVDIPASSLEVISSQMIKLKEVHFCNVPSVNDQVVRTMFQFCPRLSDVYLGGCSNITNAAFDAVPAHIKNITLRGCRKLNASVWEMLPTSVSSLNFAGCVDILNGVVPSTIHKFTSLQSLNLHGVNVEDDFIAELSFGSSQSITQLAISSSNPFVGSSVTDAGLRHIARFPNLVDLNIMGARQITDNGLLLLTLGCASISKLCIGFCSNVSDKGVQYIAHGFSKLSHLFMFQCAQLSDQGIAVLGDSAVELKVLDISGCHQVTSASIEVLIKGFVRLESITVKLCRKIHPSEFEYLRSRRHIEVIDK